MEYKYLVNRIKGNDIYMKILVYFLLLERIYNGILF